MLKVTSIFAALLLGFLPEVFANGRVFPNCLYGTTTQGNEKTPIEPCGSDDKKIGADPHVQAVMRAFNLPENIVVFQSCPGGRFSAMPESRGSSRFLVRYPSTAPSNYLAPIVHELAHVVQMLHAGGLDALKPDENVRRIELGADFLAGLAFNMSLGRQNVDDFETNLHLIGSYKIEKQDHGSPEHRGQAFRLGYNRKEPYQDLSLIEAMTYWYANDFPRLRR